MSTHAPKVDVVSKLMFLASAVAILLVVYILINSLLNTYNKNALKGEIDTAYLVEAAAENLEPIGASATSDAPVAGAAGRSGKEVYDAVCSACHATGVLDSPKFGDKAAWQKRAGGGLGALIASAMNGKGAMPAKGGDPSLTEAEVKATILYITKESGLDLGEAEPAAKKVVVEPKKEEAKAEEAKVEETKVTETEPAVAAAAPAIAASEKGKEVYDTACFACHATGVAGSPKLGDKEAWSARIAMGADALYKTAISGKGAMPPKGGNMSLADEKVKAAVDYMISKAQ